jgi:predicted transposase/invertase (TIGR01784 family)
MYENDSTSKHEEQVSLFKSDELFSHMGKTIGNQIFMTEDMEEPIIERTTKDRLFRYIFHHDREALLQLYNALNGSNYTEVDQLQIVTLEGVLYMTMKNDLAFILAHYLNVYEQQSSHNPNIPLRFLIYIAKEYQKLLKAMDVNLYGTRLIKLPAPKCVVFYSGTKKMDDDFELSLSEAFITKEKEADLELKVRVLNIHKGHNQTLMQQCKRLDEYSSFIAKIDEGLEQGFGTQHAIEKAIKYCIQHNILSDFLTAHRAEVLAMLLEEYDEQKTMDYLRREAFEEGKIEAKQDFVRKMLTHGVPLETISIYAGLTLEEAQKIAGKTV